jgi:hypothetical protein
MAKYTPIEDKDLGLDAIMKELKALGSMAVKVGFPEESTGKQQGKKRVVRFKKGKRVKNAIETGEPTIAQIATWNEYGVPSRKIPPRPFVTGWADNKADNIKATEDKLYKNVVDGKWTADDAMQQLGEFGQDGVKSYIISGEFPANSEITIKRKGSSRPLIDTGTMRNSVRFQVVKKS